MVKNHNTSYDQFDDANFSIGHAKLTTFVIVRLEQNLSRTPDPQ